MKRETVEDYPEDGPVWITKPPENYRIGRNAEGFFIFLNMPLDIPDLEAGDIVPPLIYKDMIPFSNSAKELAVVR